MLAKTVMQFLAQSLLLTIANSEDFSLQSFASLDLGFQYFVCFVQLPCSLANAFFKQFVRPLHCFFSLLALHELPDLTANTSEHFQEVFIRFADFRPEELHHPKETLSKGNRKREGAMNTFSSRNRCARKVMVLRNVSNPRRLQVLPHTSGQTNPGSESKFHRRGLELGKLVYSGLADVETTQHGAVWLRHPESAYFPSERPTN